MNTRTLYTLIIICFSSYLLEAQYILKGHVTDRNGEDLIGASILIVGTEKGTVTDINGRFQLSLDTASVTLQFMYTGFANQERTFEIGDDEIYLTVEVELKESSTRCYLDLMQLDVDIGYGLANKTWMGGFEIRPMRLRDGTVFLSGRWSSTPLGQSFQEYGIGVLHPFYAHPNYFDVKLKHYRLSDGELSDNSSTLFEINWRNQYLFSSRILLMVGLGVSRNIEMPNSQKLAYSIGLRYFNRWSWIHLTSQFQSFKNYNRFSLSLERDMGIRLLPSIRYQQFGGFREISVGLKYNFPYYRLFKRYNR